MIAKGKATVGVEEKVADIANAVDMMDIGHGGCGERGGPADAEDAVSAADVKVQWP